MIFLHSSLIRDVAGSSRLLRGAFGLGGSGFLCDTQGRAGRGSPGDGREASGILTLCLGGLRRGGGG
jgi:hypothetical protein